jgi:hypothetical protein
VEVASRPATTRRPVTCIGSAAPRLDHGLGLLGLVATIAAIGWGVYSRWQMARAFARSEQAVGVARAASAVSVARLYW